MKRFFLIILWVAVLKVYGNPVLPQPLVLSGLSVEWPCQSTKNIYETSGRYISRNIIATRAQIYNDQAILALPRYKPGVPFTLGVLSLNSQSCEPKIAPFPCWAIQEEGNCQALQSVVDLVLDMQDILWVLDVGIVNTLEQPVRRCPPKVVGINVSSGKVVKVIDLSTLTDDSSRLQYMAIDYAEDGQVFVYISDAGTGAIIVYNATTDSGYRVILPAAAASGTDKPDALYLALVRRQSCSSPVLYFTYLGSSRMFAIKTVNLRSGNANGSIVDVGGKKNKIVILGTDNGAAMFFRIKGDSNIYLWNTDTPFVPDNFLLVEKANECRLPTQVMPGYKDLMWVIESNFQDYIDNAVSCSGPSVALHPLLYSCDEY
ncbi:major royal jelly protein 1 [Ceratina calcarata]|uniref:Major royal jelly protein 1 n=1 Tax=Ceratina calcarata TaxID=156304 RepID=A0AAJ7J9T4_9HYME|nr:major royal jelly protein 1 [Ceratina calcarata]XP_026673052.1 major royal jelly protein 1 [Ceratina calcarata]